MVYIFGHPSLGSEHLDTQASLSRVSQLIKMPFLALATNLLVTNLGRILDDIDVVLKRM